MALCVIHSAAAALLWLVPIPDLGKVVLTTAIAVSLVYLLARDATLHAAHAIVELEVDASGRMSFLTRNGRRAPCELLTSTYVSPQLTIVNLRPAGRTGARRVVLVQDNVDPRDFRRLRMWLRWRHGEGQGLDAVADR